MGVLYTKNLYTQQGWTPSQIEMFLRIHTGPAGMRAGYATFESAGKLTKKKRNLLTTILTIT
jgi:hypothetical protein